MLWHGQQAVDQFVAKVIRHRPACLGFIRNEADSGVSYVSLHALGETVMSQNRLIASLPVAMSGIRNVCGKPK